MGGSWDAELEQRLGLAGSIKRESENRAARAAAAFPVAVQEFRNLLQAAVHSLHERSVPQSHLWANREVRTGIFSTRTERYITGSAWKFPFGLVDAAANVLPANRCFQVEDGYWSGKPYDLSKAEGSGTSLKVSLHDCTLTARDDGEPLLTFLDMDPAAARGIILEQTARLITADGP